MDASGIEPRESVPASRKLGRDEAEGLARAASRVIVAKGRKLDEFETGGRAGSDVVAAMLGPTGNLRAPTLRAGRILLVGFDEKTWSQVLL